VLQTAIKRE